MRELGQQYVLVAFLFLPRETPSTAPPTDQLNSYLSVGFGPVNSHVRVISCIIGDIVYWPGEGVALCLL